MPADYLGQQSSQQTYPTIFDVSLDYLPIQASAVPSERAFSSSAETDTKKHNRINPVLMEALQMLKFALKKARLDFTTGWITPESDMREREPEDDLLAALLGDEGEDSMDRLIRNLGEDDPDGEDDEDDNLVL
jgi:hAT family C-terminal dimerisation region